jgi:hypothetical protein
VTNADGSTLFFLLLLLFSLFSFFFLKKKGRQRAKKQKGVDCGPWTKKKKKLKIPLGRLKDWLIWIRLEQGRLSPSTKNVLTASQEPKRADCGPN